MSIVQICLGCKAKYKLEQRLVGRRMFCKRCHTVFTVGEVANGHTSAIPHEKKLSEETGHQAHGANGHHVAHKHDGAPANGAIHGHSDLMPVPNDPYEEPEAGSRRSKSGSGMHIRAVVQSEQDILKLDLRALCVTVAELMGYSEIVMDDNNMMHGLLDGVLVRVPNYVSEAVHTNELLTRMEWGGIAYALRHEPVGPGDHFGFYLKGSHVLGPTRAIAVCRGFLLVALQSVNRMRSRSSATT